MLPLRQSEALSVRWAHEDTKRQSSQLWYLSPFGDRQWHWISAEVFDFWGIISRPWFICCRCCRRCRYWRGSHHLLRHCFTWRYNSINIIIIIDILVRSNIYNQSYKVGSYQGNQHFAQTNLFSFTIQFNIESALRWVNWMTFSYETVWRENSLQKR